MFAKRVVIGLVLALAMMLTLAGVAYADTAAPGDKQECKNGGYEQFGFKNQGQCIKAVNHTQAHGLRTYVVSVPAESMITTPAEGGGVTYTWNFETDLSGCIYDLDVLLENFSAQNPSDLTTTINGDFGYDPITRQELTSTSTLMTAQFGQGGSDPVSNVDLTFDDAAQNKVPPVGPLVSGTYKPYTPLSDFIGQPAAGDWSLVITSATDQTVSTQVSLRFRTGSCE